MTQNASNLENGMLSAAPLVRPEMIDFAKKKMEELLEVQKEIMQTLEGINRDMFDRAKAKADIASEFVSKLSTVRSVPDATAVYQEWARREMELFAEDGRHMFENGEKFLKASRRLFENGAKAAAN